MRGAVDATYEDLAGEYYDADRHPTCANFREASGLLTDAWLLADAKHARTFCEVGCGKSLMAETLQRGSMFDRLILIDSSHSMLGYSEPWRQHRTDLVLADVARLPLRSDTIDALLSSLGDAYNTEGLWAEVARVLALDGVALFTTPSFAWAQAFRRDSADQMVAEFEVADGRIMRVPSLIRSPQDQLRLIEGQGLVVRNVIHVPIGALRHTVVSPKLDTRHGSALSIVTGYVVTKS